MYKELIKTAPNPDITSSYPGSPRLPALCGGGTAGSHPSSWQARTHCIQVVYKEASWARRMGLLSNCSQSMFPICKGRQLKVNKSNDC